MHAIISHETRHTTARVSQPPHRSFPPHTCTHEQDCLQCVGRTRVWRHHTRGIMRLALTDWYRIGACARGNTTGLRMLAMHAARPTEHIQCRIPPANPRLDSRYCWPAPSPSRATRARVNQAVQRVSASQLTARRVTATACCLPRTSTQRGRRSWSTHFNPPARPQCLVSDRTHPSLALFLRICGEDERRMLPRLHAAPLRSRLGRL